MLKCYKFWLGFLIIGFCFTLVYGVFIQKLDFETNFYCNSGNLDIYIDYENVEYPENNTLKIKDLNINGIENVECRGYYKTSLPIYVVFKLLD